MIQAKFYAKNSKTKIYDIEVESGFYKSEADIRLRAYALNWAFVIVGGK